MTRDKIINVLLAAEVQLRRTIRLASQLKNDSDIAARIPPLVEQTHRSLAALASRIRQIERRQT